MNLGSNTMYFVFAIKTRHISVSRDNGKISRKQMRKLFSCNYDHYDMGKCQLNVKFDEIDTEPLTGKSDGL